jgi:arsenite-transporting ATPase
MMVRAVLLTGKGGVGKTTTSCAMALWFAKNNFRTLILSTDPAPSVGDCFNQPVGKKPVAIDGVDNLWALEIDGEYEYDVLYDYIKHNTQESYKFISQKGAPGMNEMASLFRVTTFLYSLKYDVIVIDTAPTGHTLEMFNLPTTLADTMDKVKTMLSSINSWKQFLSGNKGKRTSARIDTLIGCIEKVSDMISNPDVTHFSLVTIPEFMALRETIRAYNDFKEHGAVARNIILNKMQPGNGNCQFCGEKRKLHNFYLRKLIDEFGEDMVIKLNETPREVGGMETLSDMGRKIMHQMANINVKPSYRVIASNGGFIVYTQIPFVQPQHLSFKIANDTNGNVLYMTINFGMHEDIRNALSFPGSISSVRAVNDDGRLTLYVG